jgi:type VI protein secretion system component Hcp
MIMTKPRNEKGNTEAPTATTELGQDELEKVAGGTHSSGSGAGKVSFNPFSITRKIDKASP